MSRCPCPVVQSLPTNANLKPIAACQPKPFIPTEKCGTGCSRNLNLKDLVACPETLCVFSPYGEQCVKSLAEQSACGPFVCPRPVVAGPCKTLVDAVTCCNPKNRNLKRSQAEKDCCSPSKRSHPCKCSNPTVRKLSDVKSIKSHKSKKSHKSHKSAVQVA